ncbi:calcium sensing receptor, chloroplastic-like [Melia azedarach]|uniref:Calcium sensing receptor, chloroplastic-like n=1 Tax=Melia azedarach TaxID=155640 RepID=A0ACC1YJR4_MELAZ|nr:calcium sensing receptor, chloroplastic-like [Melia azedarach]
MSLTLQEMAKLKYVDDSSLSVMEEGHMNFTDQIIENSDNLTGPTEPETMSTIELTPENPSSLADSLNMDNDSISNVKSSFDDFADGVSGSFSSSINKGENAVKSSLDTITSSITSITKSASEAVDNAVSRVFSSVDQTGDLAGKKLTSFSTDLREASSKAAVVAVDVLRRTIVALEDSISNGASFVVYSYGTTKELLPPEIRDALNLSEETVVKVSRPVGPALQQVSVALEGLERSLGLDPNDPIVPFVLFLGTSTTLWVFYWLWTYGGYSGDLSPKSTLELLKGKENAVLIDVRPEVMRERDGVPDLRRGARFRYASAYLPEFGGTVRKLLRGGQELDDTLTAAVIRNLKIVRDRSKVIVMDADGTAFQRHCKIT